MGNRLPGAKPAWDQVQLRSTKTKSTQPEAKLREETPITSAAKGKHAIQDAVSLH